MKKQLPVKEREKKRRRASESGEMAYVGTFVSAFAIMIFAAFAINVFSFFRLHRDLEYLTEQAVEYAAADGGTYSLDARINELCYELGLSAGSLEVSFEGSGFIAGLEGKVQYGDVIKISVSYATELRATGLLSVPVTVNCSASGLSEKYWKR